MKRDLVKNVATVLGPAQAISTAVYKHTETHEEVTGAGRFKHDNLYLVAPPMQKGYRLDGVIVISCQI